MPVSKLALLSFAAIAALGSVVAFADDAAIVVDPAIATMTADQKVEARQQAMKQNGSVLRGAMKATGDDAVKIATTVLQNFTNFPALFADGATNDKSDALPAVWTEFDKFSALMEKGRSAAQDMLTAAKSGDADKYAASFKIIGGVCGECHQSYRGM